MERIRAAGAEERFNIVLGGREEPEIGTSD
jgi:hypothetical protein